MKVLRLGERHENDWQDVLSNGYLTVNGWVVQVEKVVRVQESYC